MVFSDNRGAAQRWDVRLIKQPSSVVKGRILGILIAIKGFSTARHTGCVTLCHWHSTNDVRGKGPTCILRWYLSHCTWSQYEFYRMILASTNIQSGNGSKDSKTAQNWNWSGWHDNTIQTGQNKGAQTPHCMGMKINQQNPERKKKSRINKWNSSNKNCRTIC